MRFQKDDNQPTHQRYGYSVLVRACLDPLKNHACWCKTLLGDNVDEGQWQDLKADAKYTNIDDLNESVYSADPYFNFRIYMNEFARTFASDKVPHETYVSVKFVI